MKTPVQRSLHFYTPSGVIKDTVQFLYCDYTNTGLCQWIGFTDLELIDLIKSIKYKFILKLREKKQGVSEILD